MGGYFLDVKISFVLFYFFIAGCGGKVADIACGANMGFEQLLDDIVQNVHHYIYPTICFHTGS